MRNYYKTNSHYLTYTLSLKNVGRIYFLSLGVKGLITSSHALFVQSHMLSSTLNIPNFMGVYRVKSCFIMCCMFCLSLGTPKRCICLIHGRKTWEGRWGWVIGWGGGGETYFGRTRPQISLSQRSLSRVECNEASLSTHSFLAADLSRFSSTGAIGLPCWVVSCNRVLSLILWTVDKRASPRGDTGQSKLDRQTELQTEVIRTLWETASIKASGLWQQCVLVNSMKSSGCYAQNRLKTPHPKTTPHIRYFRWIKIER